MTNRIFLWLLAIIVGAIAVDVVVFGGADSLFLARKFVDSIEWLAFWR